MAAKTTEIISQLEHELQLLDQLHAILLREKEHLLAREFAALEVCASEKEQLSAQMNASAQKRMQILDATTIDSIKDKLTSFVNSLNHDEAELIKHLNLQLNEKLLACRDLNMVNGQVIVSNINARKEIIGLMQGHSPEKGADLYGKTGNIQSNNNNIHHEEA